MGFSYHFLYTTIVGISDVRLNGHIPFSLQNDIGNECRWTRENCVNAYVFHFMFE